MHVAMIQATLEQYDLEKGILRRMFGDQDDIQKLRRFSFQIGTDDRELTPQELLLLSELLLTNQTQEKSLSRKIFNQLHHRLFGVTTLTNESSIDVLTTFEFLHKENLLTADMIKIIFIKSDPQAMTDAIQLLAKRKELLTKENINQCAHSEAPLSTAYLFNVLLNHQLLNSTTIKAAHKLVAYRFKISPLLDILQTYHCSDEYMDMIFKHPKLIPVLQDFFAKLQRISLNLIDDYIVKTVIKLTTADLPSILKNEVSRIQRILTIFDISVVTARDRTLSTCSEGLGRNVNQRTISELVSLRKMSDPKVIVDLRTKENLHALLSRGLYIGQYVYKFLEAYRWGAFNQASAQQAFDEVIAEIDSKHILKRVLAKKSFDVEPRNSPSPECELKSDLEVKVINSL